MDLGLAARHLEVVVPPGCPPDVAVRPHNVVCVEDLVMCVQVKRGWRRPAVGDAVLGRVAARLHIEADDAVALEHIRVGVVLEFQRDMVVHVVMAILDEANKEAICEDNLPIMPPILGCSREVVHDPIDKVLLVDHPAELFLACNAQRHAAECSARHVDQDIDRVGRVLDDVSHQGLTEILTALSDHVRQAVGQCIIPIWQLRLHRRQLVDLELHRCVCLVLLRQEARQVQRVSNRHHQQQPKESCHD
mmetsp:Transcript_16113/g.41699  ORF Transcript_16113/g.41699 Transcript_16113/m.41699 type:complete len:248 (+) Transcript_16113:1252-1995(+)